MTIGPLTLPGAAADTEVVRKGMALAVHITIEDDDDRPERMVRDPDRYFADARRRAEQELTEPGSPLPSLGRHQQRVH